jgi:hypothetical protein
MKRLPKIAAMFGLGVCSVAFGSDECERAIQLSQDLTAALERNGESLSDGQLREIGAQIHDLIDRVNAGGGGGGGGRHRLVCKTSSGKAAIFDVDANAFVDQYYAQTLDVCNRIIDASRNDLTCSSNAEGKTALYELSRAKYVDGYYSKTAGDCIRTLDRSHNGLTCATNQAGDAAIYDLRNDRFVDSTYSKTLEQCLNSI